MKACLALPFLLLLFQCGCSTSDRDASKPAEPKVELTAAEKELLELFEAHGIEAEHDGEWIVFLKHQPMKVRAVVHDRGPSGGGKLRTVQLDVGCVLPSGQLLVESFAGIGESVDQAAMEAVGSFAANSFHVLASAFLGVKDEQANSERWTINGVEREVIIGNIASRGKFPDPSQAPTQWLDVFREKICNSTISSGTHWVRLFFAQMDNEQVSMEVLLDNKPWPEAATEMAAHEWPKGEAFYSIRLFLVIKDIEGQKP